MTATHREPIAIEGRAYDFGVETWDGPPVRIEGERGGHKMATRKELIAQAARHLADRHFDAVDPLENVLDRIMAGVASQGPSANEYHAYRELYPLSAEERQEIVERAERYAEVLE